MSSLLTYGACLVFIMACASAIFFGLTRLELI